MFKNSLNSLSMKLRVTEKVMSNWLVYFWDTTLCDRIEHYTVSIDYNQDKKIVPVFCQQLCVFLGESQAFLCFSLNATEVFLLLESLPSFPCHLSPHRYARTKFFCWRFLAIFLLIMFRTSLSGFIFEQNWSKQMPVRFLVCHWSTLLLTTSLLSVVS